MSKILTKSNMKKLIIAIVIVLLFNAIFPVYSHAIELDGGILIDPITYLLNAILDSFVYLIQWSLTGVTIPVASERVKPGVLEVWRTDGNDEIAWPTIVVTPEEIFGNRLPALNANFFKSIPTITEQKDGDWFSKIDRSPTADDEGAVFINDIYESSLTTLRKTISKWYVSFRNLAAAALLSVLIYIAIRMIISSVAEDKAKYKSMIMSWLTAIAIVFFLHFAMSFIMWFSDSLVKIIQGVGMGTESYNIKIEDTEQTFKLTKDFKVGNMIAEEYTGANEAKINNLMEVVRVYMNAENLLIAMAYGVIYIAMIIFTLKFAWKYLLRFINLAFLTILAPLIAITYPMDKLKDGNAQAFSFWIKEYTMNAMLPVIHMLIYVALIGSAIELAQVNFLYTIAVFFFMDKAEDLIKNMFGLSGGATDNNGSFAGGALAASAANKAKGALGTAGKSSSKDSIRTSNSSALSESSNPDTVSFNDAYKDNNNGSNSTGNTENDEPVSDVDKITAGKEGKTTDVKEDKITAGKEGKITDVKEDKTTDVNKKTGKTGSKLAGKLKAVKGSIGRKAAVMGATTAGKFKAVKGSIGRKAAVMGATKAGKFKAARRAIGIKRPAPGTAKKRFKSVGRIARKAAVMGVTTAVGGGLGLAAAMGTGNAALLGAGLGVGALAGKNFDSGMMKVGSTVKNNYRTERHGEEKAEQIKRFEDFKNNSENLAYFKKEFAKNGKPLSNKEALAKMKESRSFIESGYSNPKDVKKLMKIKEKNQGLNDKQIMLAEQLTRKEYSKKDFVDSKKSRKIENGLVEELKASGVSQNETELKQLANNQMNAMRSAHGLAHKGIPGQGRQNSN